MRGLASWTLIFFSGAASSGFACSSSDMPSTTGTTSSSSGGGAGTTTSGTGGAATTGTGGTGGSMATGTGGSATTGAGGGTCGGSMCRAGAHCVSDACEYDCMGAQVPGDYPTIEAAVTALNQGNGGTVCVGAVTTSEIAHLSFSSPITIIGVSAEKTKAARLVIDAQGGDLTVKGLRLSSGAQITARNAKISFQGCRLDEGLTAGPSQFDAPASLEIIATTITASSGHAIDLQRDYAFTLLVDQCDLSAPGGAAFHLFNHVQGVAEPATYTIQSSYLHDSTAGLRWDDNGDIYNYDDVILFENNTVSGNQTGISIPKPTQLGLALRHYNNVYTKNQLALDLSTSNLDVMHGNNALSDNTANYAGQAVDGPGYVKSALMLDTSTPPAPLPESPCRGAGDPQHAPSYDYWGAPRSPKVDIGAVEGP